MWMRRIFTLLSIVTLVAETDSIRINHEPHLLFTLVYPLLTPQSGVHTTGTAPNPAASHPKTAHENVALHRAQPRPPAYPRDSSSLGTQPP